MNGRPTGSVYTFKKLMGKCRQRAYVLKMMEMPDQIKKKEDEEKIILLYGKSGTGKSTIKLLLEG